MQDFESPIVCVGPEINWCSPRSHISGSSLPTLTIFIIVSPPLWRAAGKISSYNYSIRFLGTHFRYHSFEVIHDPFKFFQFGDELPKTTYCCSPLVYINRHQREGIPKPIGLWMTKLPYRLKKNKRDNRYTRNQEKHV